MTISSLRVFLIDDEPLALRRLARLLKEIDRVVIVDSETDPQVALAKLQNSSVNVDLLFLDIQMPGMSGFELLAQLSTQPIVVFTTAYDEYALSAFQVNSIDYLLKPIDKEQLQRAVKKLEHLRDTTQPRNLQITVEQLAALQRDTQLAFPERIVSRVGECLQVIDLEKVSHFISKNKLTLAVTEEKNHVVDYSIAELEQKLDPNQFVRIHRSTILNTRYASELHHWFSGRMLIRLKNKTNDELIVARDRVRLLRQRFGF